ncbi:MAG: thioredoxin [Zetaproteobacteria bacterium]|nr:MAG: thioredoxin [Zetaproteobacteria bacterium]
MASAKIVEATDQDFQEKVIKASKEKPVLVDFWAPWCGPCRMIAPVLEELAEEMDEITIVKVNVDDSPTTPAQYGVRGIPTLMLFKDGEVQGTKVGALPKAKLEAFIREHI